MKMRFIETYQVFMKSELLRKFKMYVNNSIKITPYVWPQ